MILTSCNAAGFQKSFLDKHSMVSILNTTRNIAMRTKDVSRNFDYQYHFVAMFDDVYFNNFKWYFRVYWVILFYYLPFKETIYLCIIVFLERYTILWNKIMCHIFSHLFYNNCKVDFPLVWVMCFTNNCIPKTKIDGFTFNSL